MRTTLTLDRDVAALLRLARARRKEPLKRIVNEALRHGLLAMTTPPRAPGRYRMEPVDLGRCLIGNLDDVAEALALAEGEAHSLPRPVSPPALHHDQESGREGL